MHSLFSVGVGGTRAGDLGQDVSREQPCVRWSEPPLDTSSSSIPLLALRGPVQGIKEHKLFFDLTVSGQEIFFCSHKYKRAKHVLWVHYFLADYRHWDISKIHISTF